MGKKQFYSIEEASAKLNKTADELKGLVRDGTLREFRDAGKVFFKSEDVEKLAAKSLPPAADDTGDILLEAVGDEGSGGSTNVPVLIESSGGTSIIGLEPIGDEDDSQGTKGGSKAGSRGPGKKKGDTVITASGIGVFDQDELEIDADPMAKTQITAGAVEDQISLEGAGSGSGLLDLAREADDTALGADLLDEIYPGEEVSAAPAAQKTAVPARAQPPAEDTATASAAAIEEPAGEAIAPVIIAPTGDPGEGMMTGLLVAAMLVLALGTTVTGGLVQGFLPDFARLLSSGMYFWIFLGGSVGVAGIGVAVGWFLGRSMGGRRR